MSDFSQEKQLITEYYGELDQVLKSGKSAKEINAILEKYCADDYLWRGFHPFNEIISHEKLATKFWQPLSAALTPMQRRMDIFMAGENFIDDGKSKWVVSMGHLMGLFDSPWLNIRPTRKMAMLRYCEFHRVENGKICETAMYFDIPHLMMQAGLQPFPPQTASHMVQPGPVNHKGLMFNSQDPEEGKKTMDAINFMVTDISSWSGGRQEPLVDELRRSWNDDMIWWGPAGIGATYTIERYAEQHSGAFRKAFGERQFNGHVAKIAEGEFGGFFGWPNLTLTPIGGFMGMPATNKAADMRVIDIYRREGDKLSENWIFIDLLHFWNQLGVDILSRTTELQPN